MSALLNSILATLAVSAVSLVGILFIRSRPRTERSEIRLLGFAAGVLLAAAFLELIPEAVEEAGDGSNPLVASLAAMVAFFFLEQVLQGFHVHEGHAPATSSYLILIGDGVHNLVDGVIIAAAFVADPSLGVATTIAVLAHEIPQEVADYGILVSGGFTPRRALSLNFASGLLAVVGAVVTVALGDVVEDRVAFFVAATAGMFIYIAAADLIPRIHSRHTERAAAYGPYFLTGVGVVALLTALVPE